MCIMAMAWKAHPRWHLIIAGNRDELHDRPAAALARWDQPNDLIAGRDLLSGGTWMGVSEQGRAAIITNLRGHGDPRHDRVSRGALVTDLLKGIGPHADMERAALDAFNPFNLILVDREEAHFLTNRPDIVRTVLTPGIYGLSNGTLDAPWPKTLALKSALLDWLMAGATSPKALFDALRSENLPHIGINPDIPSDVPAEAAVSPIFINNRVYGTRCSTIITIDAQGHGTITERRFDAQGIQTGEDSIAFSWQL